MVLAALVRFALRAQGEAEDEDALFMRARELRFEFEEYGAQRVRGQLPLLGIPIEHVFSPVEVGVPGRGWDGRIVAVLDDDPRMRDDPETREGRLPVAWREDPDESLLLFLLPGGLRRADGTPRDHDPLILAVNPRATALVAKPDLETRESVERERGWTVEVQGAWLLVYRLRPSPIDSLDAFLDEALEIAHRFC